MTWFSEYAKYDLLYTVTPGPTQGQLYHEIKGVSLDKYHTKVKPCSMKDIKVMSSKRNAKVKVNVNMHVNCNILCPTTMALGLNYRDL